MTEDGKAIADRWWESVRSGTLPALVLVGHADQRGSDAYNDKLSKAGPRHWRNSCGRGGSAAMRPSSASAGVAR